jgi:predicted N-acetyltransferase YhbS
MTIRTDGIELRNAVPGDRGGVAELIEDRMGTVDRTEALVAFNDTNGPERFFVAVEGDRVVSVLSLWQERVRIGEVWLPAGQLDFVATAKEYEGRGLVRDLIGLAHARSRERGDLLQVLVGIPYFYRQFGYTYVLPMPGTYTLPAGRKVESAAGEPRIRQATAADLPHLRRLQDQAQAGADVAMPHSDVAWTWLSRAETVEFRLAESGGRLVGMARTRAGEDSPVELAELSAVDVGTVRALLADAQGRQAEHEVRVVDRPGTAVSAAFAGWTGFQPNGDEIMLRVSDPASLLAALAPELSARLTRSAYASDTGELLISLYRQGIVLSYAGGAVTAVQTAPGTPAPVSAGGAGVPPDLVADLLFGPHGAEALADMHPDCQLGRVHGLMTALFPPRRADILTYYLA